MSPATRATRTSTALFLALGLLLVSNTPALASRVRPMTLEEITGRAGRIFAGRCTGVRVVEMPGRGMHVTEITFRVDRTLKGRSERRLTIRQTGGDPSAPARGGEILGLPAFRPGEEVILFLYGESASGLTSPVGLGQGKFVVHTGKDGIRRAVNGFGNRDLFPETHGKSGRSPGVTDEWQRRGIPADDLLERVRILLRAARGDP